MNNVIHFISKRRFNYIDMAAFIILGFNVHFWPWILFALLLSAIIDIYAQGIR